MGLAVPRVEVFIATCSQWNRRGSLIIDHPVWRIPDMNRMLVEQGTHPNVLRERANVLGDLWLTHEQEIWAEMAAEGGAAGNHELDREKYLMSKGFPIWTKKYVPDWARTDRESTSIKRCWAHLTSQCKHSIYSLLFSTNPHER